MPTNSLDSDTVSLSFSLSPVDNQRLAELCGDQGAHLKQIEQHLSIQLSHRAELFYAEGPASSIKEAKRVVKQLYRFTSKNRSAITSEAIHLALVEQPAKKAQESWSTLIKVRNHHIRPKNAAQNEYLQEIRKNDINFGIGPAGTGKTYLAVACAAEALSNKQVERIILVRPAVEAGEKLGFLPGDIGQKVDPYLRPLYDALHEMLGIDRVAKLIERGVIELAPLAYMRGRTLNESFILLDEAQNTTVEQMKMFLTRMGYGSKIVVTGDTSQIDLPKSVRSGLVHVQEVLKTVKGISFTHFSASDVVRHSLVQRVVEAYEKDNSKRSKAA